MRGTWRGSRSSEAAVRHERQAQSFESPDTYYNLVRQQDDEVAEELGKRGLEAEAAGDAARMQLVADMSGDAERDAMRDAAAFVDGVRE